VVGVVKLLVYATLAGVVLFALIDALSTRRGLERLLPKWLWVLVIVLVPVLGAVGWLFAGRPVTERMGVVTPGAAAAASRVVPRGGRRRAPVAPDDDPAFLRRLSEEQWSRRMRELRESGAAPRPGPEPPSTDQVAGDRGSDADPAPDAATGNADQ
jgi:hypothetical protein